jgi:hypothetical protein
MEGKLAPNQKGIALFTLASPAVTALQEAYVNKVIETVNDLDHVLYEIANESDFTTTEWQYHFIRHIKKVEAGKPKQHPVGMTSIGYGVDDLDRLLLSPADWISPNPDRFDYKTNPPAATGDKVILIDTDHLWGVGGDVAWVWKCFLRGLNPIFIDSADRTVGGGGFFAGRDEAQLGCSSSRRGGHLPSDSVESCAMQSPPVDWIRERCHFQNRSSNSIVNAGRTTLVSLPPGPCSLRRRAPRRVY